MENVIPIEDLPTFIDQAIAKVNEGVALARRRGILAELPKEVQFDVTLISKWQEPTLKVSSNEETISIEESNDTGESKTVQNGTSKRSGTETGNTESRSQDSSTSSGQNATYTYSD